MRKRLVAVLSAAILALTVGASSALAYWPVPGGRVSQGFHAGHPAYDIYAPAGRAIAPVRAGTTVFAGWRSNCGGYQVWVNHGNGLYSAYYHMSRVLSFRGERLSRGEVLGRVGSTGCATGPHVHVEVWRGYPWALGSYRVNPFPYMRGGYVSTSAQSGRARSGSIRAVIRGPRRVVPRTIVNVPTGHRVNIRRGPGLGYAVVNHVREWRHVTEVHRFGRWVYITLPGRDGWVSASHAR